MRSGHLTASFLFTLLYLAKDRTFFLDVFVNIYKLFKYFSRIKSIYDSLPKKQKRFVSPSGRFIDSPKTVVRVIYSNDEGFAEIYELKPREGFITMAIRPECQGKGLGKRLLTRALQLAKKKKLKTVIYEADRANHLSIKFAKKYLGKPDEVNDESIIWEIKI